jgi:hypothetical protein
MLKKFSFTLLIISFVLISCAKKSDDSSSSTSSTCTADTATTASGSITVGSVALAGTYTGACATTLVEAFAAAGLYPSDTKSIKTSYIVTSSTSFSNEQYYYSDTTCSTQTMLIKGGKSDVAVGDASGSDYKVTWKSSSYKEVVNSDAAETWREATYSNSGSTVDLTQGCVKDSSGSGSEYKDLWNVTSTVFKNGSADKDDYPTSVGSTEYTKQ